MRKESFVVLVLAITAAPALGQIRVTTSAGLGKYTFSAESPERFHTVKEIVVVGASIEHRLPFGAQIFAASLKRVPPQVCVDIGSCDNERKRYYYVMAGPSFTPRLGRFSLNTGLAGGYEIPGLKGFWSWHVGGRIMGTDRLGVVAEYRRLDDTGGPWDAAWHAGITWRFK